MLRPNSSTVCVVLMLLNACAASRANRGASSPTADASGFMLGQIKIYEDGSDITHTCEARFGDSADNTKLAVTLDKEGWLFSSMASGATYLSQVRCSNQNELEHSLQFQVAEAGKATYFGSVALHLPVRERHQIDPGYLRAALGAVSPLAGAVVTATTPYAVGKPHAAAVQTKKRVTVTNRSGSAMASYQRKYGHSSLVMVPSLAGLRARVQAQQSEAAQAHQNGDLISSETDVNGVKVIWLGIAQPQQPRLALRLRHWVARPELNTCHQLEAMFDGNALRLPITYNVVLDAAPVQETVQADLDERTLKAILSSDVVHLRACGLTRRLNYEAGLAGTRVLASYRSLLAHRAAGVRIPEPDHDPGPTEASASESAAPGDTTAESRALSTGQ